MRGGSEWSLRREKSEEGWSDGEVGHEDEESDEGEDSAADPEIDQQLARNASREHLHWLFRLLFSPVIVHIQVEEEGGKEQQGPWNEHPRE